jgi:ParB-like chromosome segregation protein Spo0J
MAIHSIKTSDVLIDESKFSLKDFLFVSDSEPSCYMQSFKKLGIIYPIIVQQDENAQMHLVDGKKRIQYAKQNQTDMIHATVLPETTPVSDIIVLILCDKRSIIESSIMNRIQFVSYAISLNVPESWILQSLCIPFDFKPHGEFLYECERVYNLPKKLKLFCHNKKLSLKQLINFACYAQDLLEQLIEWNSVLQLTASTMDEIASNLKDYLRSSNKNIKDFLSAPGIEEILDSSLSTRDKTERLRQAIFIKQFPVLSSINERIKKTVEDLNTPKEMSINWDRTLENKNVNLNINVQSPEKWQGILNSLKSKEIKKAIESILEEL